MIKDARSPTASKKEKSIAGNEANKEYVLLKSKEKPQPLDLQELAVSTPGAIRTHGLQSRSLTLYPTELRARVLSFRKLKYCNVNRRICQAFFESRFPFQKAAESVWKNLRFFLAKPAKSAIIENEE